MEQYLELFLETLPKQTWFDRLEVVLDHNEPTKHEIELVRAFQKRYPGRLKHIIVNKVDPIGTSMNRCIKEASGDFVTIWNVDDLRTDNSIELQARVLVENPSIDIVFGNFKIVRKFGSTAGRMIEHKFMSVEERTRGMLMGPFIMFRKSLCEKAGYFDEQLKSGADYDLSLRLNFNGRAYPVLDNLGFYLDEGKGASTRPDSKQQLEMNVICLRYGVVDRLNPDAFGLVGLYDIPHIYNFGKSIPVGKFVPQYDALMKERYESLFMRGWRKRKLLTISQLRKFKHFLIRTFSISFW